jgi:two-component system, NarL family, nitrate/nitrite response regulator NarL
MAITVVLADDHPIVLDALQSLFSLQADLQVLARCLNGAETLRAVAERPPDILVLDLRMPNGDGLSVLRELARRQSPTRVVVLTAAVSDDDVLEAIRLGIRGLVLKESAPKALVECVRRVHAGGQYIEPRFLTRALDAAQQRNAGRRELGGMLTPRELQVLRMVAGGLRNRAIAQQLEISEGTVKIHLHNIYEKVDVENRVELALFARAKGFV